MDRAAPRPVRDDVEFEGWAEVVLTELDEAMAQANAMLAKYRRPEAG